MFTRHLLLMGPYCGFLRKHILWALFWQNLLDETHDDEENNETHFPFFSESSRHSICYSLSLTLFKELHFHFLWLEFGFCPALSHGPSWLVCGSFLGSWIQPACTTFFS